MDEQQVWAWQCEHCHHWIKPDVQPTAVIIKEPGPEISNGSFVERLYLTRKLVICYDCVQNMRTTWG